MTHDEMIEVIKAHKEGKKLERRIHGEAQWLPTDSPVFNFQLYDYRVKKEPAELWAIRHADGSIRTFNDKEAAISIIKFYRYPADSMFLMREVLDA